MAKDIDRIFYYEILAENEKINLARYLKGVVGRCGVKHGDVWHPLCLLYNNARPIEVL